MIQFLKPGGGRRRSSRHLDVVELAPLPLPDVNDWLAENAEPTGLTDEEAAEIQIAFQQVPDLTVPESLAIEPVVMADPLDLTQVAAIEPLLALAPAPMWPRLVESLTPTPLLDADALVEFRLDTCLGLPSAAVGELVADDLAVDATPVAETPVAETPVAATPVDATPALELPVVENIAIADLVIADSAVDADIAVDATPIDWVNPNWASEAVDVAVAESTESLPTSPLSYFQYYLDENASGEGDADATPAPYVTPWRQPSMPAGLIGAGVLGATLVSGFVIADTVKNQPVTTAKKPTPPASLQSMSAKDQLLATAPLPKAVPPESMKPEVALPLPKRGVTIQQPVFPTLPPMTGMSPLTGAIAVSQSEASNALPQSSAPVGSVAVPAPVAAAPVILPAPVVPQIAERPVVNRLPQPTMQQAPAPVPAPAPMPAPRSFAPESRSTPLPELTPDMGTQEVTPMPVPAVPVQSSPIDATMRPVSSLSELTPEPVSSPLQRVPAASPVTPPVTPSATGMPPASAVVPVDEVVTPTLNPVVVPIAPPMGEQPAAAAPTERVFNRAVVPSTMPPVATAQTIADRSSRLPPQVQNLLAVPAVNAYVPTAIQWRPLDATEARLALTATKLGAFTRMQMSQQEYRDAYRLVSDQSDALPSFGFIDYQRQLIILPPQPETAVNPIEHSRSHYGEAVLALWTTSL